MAANKSHIVHRFSQSSAHRIEIHSANTAPKIGAWAPWQKVAELDGLRATSPYWGDSLPRIFRTAAQPHQEVTE